MADVTGPAILAAHNLGLKGPDGWSFRNVDLTIARATVVAIVGTPGSGRSALVRTLAGKETPTQGRLEVFDQGSWVSSTNGLRGRIAVAQLPEHLRENPTAQIHECVADQLLLTGISRSSDVFDTAAEIVGFRPERTTTVADLSHLQRRLLELALALTAPVAVVVIDDVDARLSTAEAATLWSALRSAASTGCAIVAGTSTPPDAADQTVVLDTPQHSH
jgi:ABC-2 type transport system ATP-binding protein